MRAPLSSARALLCAFLAHMVRSDWQNCLSEVLKGEHARFDGEQCETAGSQGAKCANRRDHAHFRAQNCEATFDVRFEWSVYSRRVRRVQAPESVSVCVPASCTPEMVGRLVAPRYVLADFNQADVRAWPRLGTEVIKE